MDRALTNLEMLALGIVWRKKQCTAYSVMRSISTSKSQAYKSGAGSVYPLLKRMAAARLLCDDKGSLSLTEHGLQTLKSWLSSPLEPSEISANQDPLRARVYFLAALDQAERQTLIEAATQGLRDLKKQLQMDESDYLARNDRFGALAVRGAVMETEARQRWLALVRSSLNDEP